MRDQIQLGILIFGISFLILGLTSNAICQPGKEWKARNDKGNRYEGSIDKEVASESPIKLVSFYSFKEAFNPDSILKVKFYIHDVSRVDLTAQELENKEFYWMEAKRQKWRPGWNEFGPWPVETVLDRLSVPVENLGVLVKLFNEQTDLEEESGLIAPAVIYHSSSPSEINFYTAFFVPGKTLSGVKYQIYKGCRGNEIVDEGPLGRQGMGIPFPVEFQLAKDWQGIARLKIIANIKNDPSLIPSTEEYRFYHIPVLKN